MADAPFAQTFMTACSPGIVAAGDGEPPLRRRRRSTCGPWPPRCAPSTTRSSTAGLLLQIDAPDLALERHTLFADRPLARVPRLGRARGRRHQRRARRASTRRTCGCTCAGATTRARTRTTSPLDEIQPLLYEAQRRRARDLDGERPPRPRAPVLRAPPAARRHGARRRRDRHDEQLRRAPRGRGRPPRPRSPRPSATRAAIIAGTDCGFDTSAGIGDVAPSLVWEKLRALRAGRRPGLRPSVLSGRIGRRPRP